MVNKIHSLLPEKLNGKVSQFPLRFQARPLKRSGNFLTRFSVHPDRATCIRAHISVNSEDKRHWSLCDVWRLPP
ncbi:hypothetical protein ACLKA6_018406 [Drosophila palustris]